MIPKQEKPQVLREIALHPQPRTLGRAPRELPMAAAKHDALPSKAQTDTDADEARAAYEQAKQQGYADGVAAGKKAGFDEGRKEGLQIGQRAGEEAAHAVWRTRLEQLDGLLQSLSAQAGQLKHLAEDDMVDLVYASICRIAGELAISNEGIRQLVRNAVAQLHSRPVVAIRIHPADAATLQADAELAALLRQQNSAGAMQWIADERVELGGCMIDSPQGSLDARLDTQLRRLRDVLLQTRSARMIKEA